MPLETDQYTLGAAKGLDTRWKTDFSGAQTAENLAWDPRGGWRTCGGFRRVLLGRPDAQHPGEYVNPFAGLGTIWSMHQYSQHNGARSWLLFEADDGASSNPTTCSLYYLNPSTRTNTPYTVIKDRSGRAVDNRTVVTTPWQRTQSCTWQERIYLVNGIDTPLVFDGTMADRAGFDAAPGAPQAMEIQDTTATYYDAGLPAGAAQIVGVGVGPVPPDVTTSSYWWAGRFVVTFINSRGEESPPSFPSTTVRMKTGASAITGGRNFIWLDIPTGGDNVVARRVYRTKNMVDSEGNDVAGVGDVFYYQQTIEDNDTRGFEVFLDDGSLGSTLDPLAYGLWPTGAKFACSFKGRMYLAGMNDTEVAFSSPGAPENFPPLNLLSIGDAHLGPVTGMYSTKNTVVVFKARGVYLIKDDGVNGPQAETLTHDTGSVCPRGVIEVPNVGLAFVANDGIWVLQGALENEGYPTRVMQISTPLYDLVKRWNTSAMLNGCAVSNPHEKEVCWFVPTLGVANANLGIIFHTDTGQWTTRTNMPVSCALNTSDHRGYMLFGSYDANHKGIHVYSRGWDDMDGVSIVPIYETDDLDFGALFRSASVKSVMVYCIGYGDNDLTFNYKTGRRLSYIRSTAAAQDQQYPEAQNRMEVYGPSIGAYANPNAQNEVAVWDTSTWGDWRPIVLRFDTDTQSSNPGHEFAAKLSVDTTDGACDMEILGIDVEIRHGDLRNAKPLNPAIGTTLR